eukprot:TRINITY_DN171_c0_g2_i2.p2 TRINITY_DN171_c0_g2~~TRINITY_DN171_c0_g2_i2.p2  ORF type:complete len:64 (-),score=0.14 TRINITY_DN171_c0_g2_i2:70-261(-)
MVEMSRHGLSKGTTRCRLKRRSPRWSSGNLECYEGWKDPGSELRLVGRREKRRAKIINGMEEL